MNRGFFLAVVIAVVAAVGLGAAAFNDSDDATAAVPGSDSASNDSASNDPPSDDSQARDPQAANPQAGSEAEPSVAAPSAADAPPMLGQSGTLTNIDAWLQTDADSFEDFDGQVRIVQFWTYSCHNCTATIPFLQEIYAAHNERGLEIIGVHAPEFSFEEDIDGVAEAAVELGVTWPIAVDNSKINFRSWQPGRRFWPRTFVLDQNGEIRFDKIGEGKYDELEETVAWLIEHGP